MQNVCAICNEDKGSLYNLKCPNCLENGFTDKLTCKECIPKLQNCPWCRSEFDPTLMQLYTWRNAPKISRVVSKKTQIVLKKWSKRKIVPKSHKETIVVKETNYCFNCCIMMKGFQILVSYIFMCIGIGITGFMAGLLICGKPKCYLCLVSGACGVFFSLFSSLTISVALQRKHVYKYKVIFGGQICCSIFFVIILILSLGSIEGCKMSSHNLFLLLFIVPCFFGITAKTIYDCATTCD